MQKYYERKKVDWADELNGVTLVDAKKYLDRLIEHLGKDATLKLEWDWDSCDYYIEVEREPTYEEANFEKIKREKKEKADRAKFEKLKTEYGW